MRIGLSVVVERCADRYLVAGIINPSYSASPRNETTSGKTKSKPSSQG